MTRFNTRLNGEKAIRILACVVGVACVLTSDAMAQYGAGGGGTTGGSAAGAYTVYRDNYHVGFDTPEAWGLKYFASTSLLSGLPQPETQEGRRVGSVTAGFEVGWVPALDAGQRRI